MVRRYIWCYVTRIYTYIYQEYYDKTRKEAQDRVQGPTEIIAEYVAAMTELYDRNPDMTMTDLVEYLHNHLQPNFKEKITLQLVRTGDDFLQRGLNLERQWQAETSFPIVTGEEETQGPEPVAVNPENTLTNGTINPFSAQVVPRVDPVPESPVMETPEPIKVLNSADSTPQTKVDEPVSQNPIEDVVGNPNACHCQPVNN
ncbi:hypothetical protein FQA39_LY08055 [Lamprigera yunnana]|nr:hypothetical protein FQA39_LY08055 [Lamprigera yunnana]